MPATISVTPSTAAAMRWFTEPSRSRNLRPIVRRRMHPFADFVRDEHERDQPLVREGREIVSGPKDRVVIAPTVQEVRDPDRQAVDDDQVDLSGEAAAGGRQIARLLDRDPVPRALRPVPGDAISHLAVDAAGRGDEADAPGCRAAEGDGVPTLAAPGASKDEMRLAQRRPQVLPRRPVSGVSVRAGLLALGSSYSPRLPGSRGQWLTVGFVPDYSDGVAADSHRLPWGPHRGPPEHGERDRR